MPLLELSLPTGVLASPAKSWWDRKFVFPVYRESHKHYEARNGFLQRWDTLGEDLSVSLHLPMLLEQGRAPCVHIAVRSHSAREHGSEATLLIEAIGGAAVFQEAITVYRLGATPRIVALPSIPLRWVDVTDDGQLVSSYTKLRIWVTARDGVTVSNPAERHPHHSSSVLTTDHLNERFEEKWGTFWNCGAIDRAVRRRGEWLTFKLATQKMFRANKEDVTWSEVIGALWRRFIGKPLCWLLTLPWLLRAYFWTPIILRGGKVIPSDLDDES